MSPRGTVETQRPSDELLHLLNLEDEQVSRLAETRSRLTIALRELSGRRGLIVPLRGEQVRQELKRELAGG